MIQYSGYRDQQLFVRERINVCHYEILVSCNCLYRGTLCVRVCVSPPQSINDFTQNEALIDR